MTYTPRKRENVAADALSRDATEWEGPALKLGSASKLLLVCRNREDGLTLLCRKQMRPCRWQVICSRSRSVGSCDSRADNGIASASSFALYGCQRPRRYRSIREALLQCLLLHLVMDFLVLLNTNDTFTSIKTIISTRGLKDHDTGSLTKAATLKPKAHQPFQHKQLAFLPSLTYS